MHTEDTTTTKTHCQVAREVIAAEAGAIKALGDTLDEASFAQACDHMINCKGRVITTGMGKSGHIAGKIAATLASTGTPSFFVHPAEASHGDLGMITKDDMVLAISNSGETTEILTILPLIKRLGIPLVAITNKPNSTMAKFATIHLAIQIDKEACPLNLAPTTSTSVSLVLGDALAMAVLTARGFTPEDFAWSHPGGRLGRRLLLQVKDIMHQGADIPLSHPDDLLNKVLLVMTQKSLGVTIAVEQPGGPVIGIFTDGDLRRAVDKGVDIHNTQLKDVMTHNCKTIRSNILAAEALRQMEQHKIMALIVTDEQQHPVGVLHMHALLQAGVV